MSFADYAKKKQKERGIVNTPKKDVTFVESITGSPLPSAKSSIKNNFSSEAWTRATPSQTKIPEKRSGTFSDAAKGTVKQYGAALGDSLATQYQATQGMRDTQNKELADAANRTLKRAQSDLDMMLSDNRKKPGTWSAKDIQVQRNVLKDAQQKADVYGRVSSTQKKVTATARDATLNLSQSGAQDLEKAKQGHGAVVSTLVDAGSSFAQSMGDATVGAATGTGMLPFVLRSFGGGTLEAHAGGASFEDQLKYGTATAAKEYITEKLFGLAVPQKIVGKAGRGSFDEAIESSIRNVTNKLAKTETGRKALGGVMTWLASGVTEGLEEGIGAAADDLIITPTLKTWEQDKRTTMEKFEDGLYDMLIGSVSGLMGVTNLVSYNPTSTTQTQQQTPTVSPAADAQTRARQAASEAVKQGAPEATVLSAAETAFTDMGMNVKTARKKAAVVQSLVNGEEVSQQAINTLNPTSKETQAAFTRLTGVEFPDKMTVEQMYMLYRSASQKAQEATVTTVDLADQAMAEAAQEEAAAQEQAIQEQTSPTDISEVTLEQMRDAGSEVSPETQARIDAAAADLSGRVSNLDIGPDGNALATYGQFAEAYRAQVNDQATDAEVKQQYQNFRNDSRTVLFGGHRLTYGQFSGFMREVVAQGQEISDTDMETLFNQAILDTLSGEDALDRYEGKTQATSKRTGTSRTLKLDNGQSMTRDQFEAFFRDYYGKQGRNLSEDELDAFYERMLFLADKGQPLPYDEAMAQFMKEESDNGRDGEEGPDTGGGRLFRHLPSVQPEVAGRAGSSSGEGDARGESASGSPRGRKSDGVGRGRGTGQRAEQAKTENSGRSDYRARADGDAGPNNNGTAVRPDSHSAGERLGVAEDLRGGERHPGEEALHGVRGGAGKETGIRGEKWLTQKERAQALRDKIAGKPNATKTVDLGREETKVLPFQALSSRYYTKEMRQMKVLANRLGLDFYVSVGSLAYDKTGGGIGRADGLTVPGVAIIIRGDSDTRTVTQIGKHESIHGLSRNNPVFLDTVRDAFIQKLRAGSLGIDQYYKYLESRYASYKNHYGDVTDAYAHDYYLEELVGDIYGGIADRLRIDAETMSSMQTYFAPIIEDEISKLPETISESSMDKADKQSSDFVEGRTFSLAPPMKSWSEQVDGLTDRSGDWDAGYIPETPQILGEIGLGDLPLCMSKKHLRDIMHRASPSNVHWHGLSEDVVKRLPELLSKPAMVMNSNTVQGDVMVVTTEADADGNPIVVTIHPNGKAIVDGTVGPANFITSMYGRSNFSPRSGTSGKNNLLYLALRNRNILYWNKKRTEALAEQCGLRLPFTLNQVQSDTILKPYRGYVKGNTPQRMFSLEDYTGADMSVERALSADDVEYDRKSDTYTDPETGEEVFYNEEASFYGGKFYRDEVGDYLILSDDGEVERPGLYDLEEATEVDYDAEMEALYAQERASVKAPGRSNDSAAANLEMTPTDTPAFRKWFRDGTEEGLLTNEDGSPKALLHGTPRAGFTRFDMGKARKGQGIYLSDSSTAAANYADPGSVETLWKGTPPKEFKPITVDSWKQATQFADADLGMRLEQGPKGYDLMRYTQDGTWESVGHFANSAPGLKKFNEQYGKLHSEAMVANPGYYQMYASMADPLVYDAKGRDWNHVMFSAVKGRFLSTDEIVNYAFEAGYDGVIFQNIQDGNTRLEFNEDGDVEDVSTPMTEYIVKSPGQVKSVYNSGTWNRRVNDIRFSVEPERRSKLEDFLRQLEDEYGEGSPDAMFATFQQLERAQQRAEQRTADAEAAQQAAEWTAEAEAEAARKAQKAKDDRRMKRQKQHYQDKARQAAVDARQAKADAVREARLAEQMNAGAKWAERLRQHDEKATAKMEQMRTSARQRMDALRIRHQDEVTAIRAERDLREAQLRADRDRKIEDVKLAERMNAGRREANARRRGEDAVAAERERRIRDHKLASQDAKEAAKVLRKYQKGDTEEVSNDPVNTLREAYHKPGFTEKAKKLAEEAKTWHRSFYKSFINGTLAVDDLSKRMDTDVTPSVLLRNAIAANSTVSTIAQEHLVGRNGDILDDQSLEDVAICWTGKGKSRKYDDASQIILQDYMLHRHNVDRMGFREKAQQELESFEASHSWLTALTPTEFAELVAEGNRTAQRYQELIEQFQIAKNKPIFKDDQGIPLSADYSRSMVEQYEQQFDWVKDKAEGIYEWWDKFMREWVVGDSLSTEEYENLRRIYPSYVPTYRVDKGGFTAGVNTFGGTASTRKATRKATGGGSPVANIEDSYIRLMRQNVLNQRSNAVLRSITDAAMLDDTGELNGFAIFEWDSAPEMFRWSQAASGLEGALESGTDQAAVKALQKDGGNLFRVKAWVDGEQVSAVVSKELYEALDFVFNQKSGWFTKVGRALSAPMKTAITGINPGFAMRNLTRDNMTAQMNSMSVVNSISGIKFEKYFAQAIAEMAKNSENWQRFQALGGTNGSYYNNESGAYIDSVKRRSTEELNPLNKTARALGWLGENTESATRFAEYLATIDRLPGGDTYANRLMGIKNAAEVTVDFSRYGTLGKAFNAWIPYWNPAVQGIDKTVRTFFDQPSVAGKCKTLTRAALTTLPLDLILHAVYQALDRDDDWEELSDRVKDTYYCIPLPGEHRFLKIPKSRDWGQLIGTPIMRLLQAADGREDPFKNYFEVSFAPNFLWSNPTDAVGLSQYVDLKTNKDFADRDIVPSSYQDLAKGDQWNGDTSKYAKLIADLGNKLTDEDWLSPMQIDYIINDYFGDFGGMFNRLLSVGGNEGTTAKEQTKMLAEDLFGNWVADNRYSSATVSDYYDMLDKVSQAANAERMHNPDGYEDSVMYKLNSAFNAKGSPVDQITDLNAKVRELPDGAEKDAIKEQIITLAGQALEMYDAVESGEVVEPKMEMQYEQYGSTVSEALIDLKDYAEDYAFQPSNYVPKSYTDPSNKKREYILDDAAKAKYSEMYDEEYGSVMDEVIRSGKYRSANDKKKAELLEAARDDVSEQTKKNFMKWLKQNYKSTVKSK